MGTLLVGLGNIGEEYAQTRHNVGFMAMDFLASDLKVPFVKEKHASVAEARVKGRNIYLLKPSTYVNLSGKAVHYWLQVLKIEVTDLLVVLDDIALPFGKLKMKPKGSDGGHNGLKSIQQTLGTSDYARLRFGIGDQFAKGRQAEFVLGSFSTDEKKDLPFLVQRASEMAVSFASMGTELTMTRFN